MKKIQYSNLNARQQEGYNFQKVSAVLADYGFMTIRLSDDWQGADFIAQHIDGVDFMKVQLKGRLTFDKKYIGKGIKVCFKYSGQWYLYDHDQLLDVFLNSFSQNMALSKSWKEKGNYHWPRLSKKILGELSPYLLE